MDPETEKVSFVVTIVSVGPASVNLLACRLLWVCEEGTSNKAIRDRETGVGSYFCSSVFTRPASCKAYHDVHTSYIGL